MTDRRPSRTILVLQRWRTVMAVACLAFVVCLLVGRIEREELAKVAELPKWSPLLILGGAAALFFFLAPRRFVASLGLRHPFTYPPYWFGVAIGIAGAAALLAGPFADDFRLPTEASAILRKFVLVVLSTPAAVLVFAATRAGIHRLLFERKARQQEAWPSPKTPTLEEFQRWLSDDNAIDDPAADLFGHAEIARRMGQRLLAKQPAAQALVGKLGAGKTTINSLVTKWLAGRKEGQRLEIVKIELWPYESPRAAVEGVLRTIVEALSTRVSTSQLEGLLTAA